MTTSEKPPRRGAVVLPDEACPECGTLMEKTVGSMSLPVNGEEVTINDIEHLVCPSCGEALTDSASTDLLLRRTVEEYRRRHDLLTPQEIRAVREMFHLTGADFARLLSTSEGEVARWEDGRRVQTPMLDLVLRLLRDVPGSFELIRRRAA